MRIRSLAPLLALTAVTTVPLAGTASAHERCSAFAVPPHLVPGEYGLRASGSMHCSAAATNMTITVCVEEWNDALLGTGGEWWQRGCATTTQAEATQDLNGEVVVSMPVYATYLRATVTGSNDNGDTAAAKSAAVYWFNCACYVG